MDLIQLEIEQLKQQIDLLDAVYSESLRTKTKNKVNICENFSKSKVYCVIKYYLYYVKESLLYKLGYCKGKEE